MESADFKVTLRPDGQVWHLLPLSPSGIKWCTNVFPTYVYPNVMSISVGQADMIFRSIENDGLTEIFRLLSR